MIYPWLTAQFNQLIMRHQQRTLHHALLFCGIQGLGKQALAEVVSYSILCKQPTKHGACGDCQSCKLFNAGNHPDYHRLTSEKQLGVDKIREGIAKLSGTPQLGNNKVLVIPGAQTMTEAASNALLKTLEEPTVNTYLILLSDRLNGMLPTILSRCEKQLLPVPTEQQIIEWLAADGFDNVDSAQIKAYGYSPLNVKASLDKEHEGISYTEFQQSYASLLAGGETSHGLAQKWQDSAVTVLSWLQAMAHELYCQTQQPADYQKCLTCIGARKHLQHAGVNKAVILTGVLDVFSGHSV